MLRALSRTVGFTLGEVAVGVGLLSLILVSLLNLFPSSLIAIRNGERRQVAHRVAQNTLEVAMASPFSSLRSDSPELAQVNVPEGYRLTVVVSAVPPYPEDHLKRVSAVVEWEHHGKRLRLEEEVYVHPARP